MQETPSGILSSALSLKNAHVQFLPNWRKILREKSEKRTNYA